MIGDVSDVLRSIASHDRFLIACHVDPDPDCVGSMLAMDWLVERMGKEALPLSHHPMMPQWQFLPRIDRVVLASDSGDRATGKWDALIVVDCELERIGSAAQWADQVDTIINIDHHVTNLGSGSVNYIRPQAAATGQIVCDIIRQAGIPLDDAVATLLYAAIVSDTGSFRFGNTTEEVFQVAAGLVAAGARPELISRELYDSRSWNYVRLLSKALDTLGRSDDGNVAWICLTNNMLHESGARRDETDGLVQYPRMVAGVEVAIIFQEMESSDEIRISFRSRERVDVSKLAQEFGGGGHERAAGCRVPGSLDEVRARVIDRAIQVAGESH